ncbi:Transglutaminase-like enzyme, putative cysteine protease [Epibacterium ulvae]|uniref:Transglutaminase-like enzyme, putative cysteine protease n=1 Tax=Epibacterium ulvae TaxID=1156985 RepID=A0A1G5R6A1_9RHOB|nr:transglutaminase family protein [Epibacterium ulvae]SCZ68951.1 Transglutaminase-like enzyme, putative cysteine protease [Epibacterium ulvae]
MQLRIKHTTRYAFDAPVPFGLQQVRKTPKSFRNQSVLSWSTTVIGGKKELQFEDFHRNTVELVSFDINTESIELISEGVVEVADQNGITGPHEGAAPLWLFKRQTDRTKPGKGVRQLLKNITDGSTLDQLHALSAHIKTQIAYETGASQPDWSAEDAIAAGRGVCQDHSHVFVSCARALGIPARYVSGYLMMDDREVQDATHAWAEAHVDGLGWVGFDVSNGISPDQRYVRVATGLDYSEAAPVIGSRTGAAGEALNVHLEVAQQ